MSDVGITQIPDDFDVSTVGDKSTLPADLLGALREAVWRKCLAQPLWWVENFWHVIDPQTMQWVLFHLRDYQRDDGEWFVEAMGEKRQRRLVLKARQIGWTTLAAALVMWDVLFHENHPWLIASQTEGDAQSTLLTRLKDPYSRLPRWFRDRAPTLTNDNMESMDFDNGSSVLSIPATSKAGRSKVAFGVLLDEAAFADNAEGLYGGLDPLCYGPMFVFSTANGMGNFFHEQWVESTLPDSQWDGRFRPWDVVPGRDQTWYEREKRKYRGRDWLFYQEYPSTPEEAFAKTGRTVFNVEQLREEQDFREPEYRFDLIMDEDFESPLDHGEEAEHELWVWELPTVERDDTGRPLRPPNYVVGADVAEGLEHGDRTSIDILDANTGEQVASYLGHYPVEMLGALLERLGRFYYDALLLPERNNQGILPITDLQRNHYPRIWRMGPLASIPKGDKTPRYGWHTNPATKPKAVGELLRALASGGALLRDSRFLREAQTFIYDSKGGMNASYGNHDDKIMSTVIAYQGALHVGSYPITWYDDKEYPTTVGELAALHEQLKKPQDSPLDTPIGRTSGEGVTDSFTIRR